MRAGHPCRQGFWLAQGAKATLVSCKGRKSRFLLLARAQNKTASASGEALLPCLRELPYLAVPTDALGGKTVPGQRPVSRAYRHISATCLRTYAGRFTLAVWHRREWPCLLRQYFPGGISFRKITEAMVVKAAEQLNNRPRKCLHYQTPAEVFNQALAGAFAI